MVEEKPIRAVPPPIPKPAAETGEPAVLPWALIAATLMSYAALFLYIQHAMDADGMSTALVMPALGLALAATRFARVRIPHASWSPWVFRVIAMSFVMANFPRGDSGQPLLFNPSAVALIGIMLALESTIQAWRVRPWGNPPGASLILLSILTFTMASTIGEDSGGVTGNYVAFLAPAFLLLILLSFRAMERSDRPEMPRHAAGVLRLIDSEYHVNSLPGREGRGETGSRRLDVRVNAMRAAAFAVALAAGFCCWLPVHIYHDQISSWGNDLFQNRNTPEPTGLSTAPALGDMFNSSGSPTRVLRLQHYTGDPHLRGLSFETYGHGSWLPTEDTRVFNAASAKSLDAAAKGARARVTCFVDGLKEIVAPLNVAGIVPPLDGDVDLSTQSGPALRVSAETPYHYDLIQSNAQGSQGILCPPITPAERARCLDVPREIAPGVRSMALRLWQEARAAPSGDLSPPERGGSTQAKIAAVTKYLMAHYTYALTTHPGSGDKISNFLLHEHAAHCEYFASAAVMLLRVLGVPSRYVTGYYAHEAEGDSTVVRQRDSHAWAECWVEGVGWVTVDATPGDGRPDKLYPSAGFLTRMWEWLSDRFMDWQDFISQLTPAELGGGVALLAGGFYGLRWLIARRRRRAPAAAKAEYDSRDEALRDMARLFEGYLVDRGIPCPPARPWAEHVQSVPLSTAGGLGPAHTGSQVRGNSGQDRESGSQIDAFLAMEFILQYNALRFRRSFDAEQAAGARAILNQLIKEEAKT